MKTFKLHLIRHGLTQGNLDGVFTGGDTDLPLCEQGVAQIQAMAAQYTYPGVGVVFSSPMVRALQTADLLYPGHRNKIIVEEMRECRFGVFEGRSMSEMHHDPDFTRWTDPESDFTPEGGESGRQFAERLDKGFYGIFKAMMEAGITEGALIAHGGVILSLMSRWAVPRRGVFDWMTSNGCGYTVQTSTSMLMRDRMVETMGPVPEGYTPLVDWRTAADQEAP